MKRRRAPRRVDLTSAELNDVDWTTIRRSLEVVIRSAHRNGQPAAGIAAQRTLEKVQRR